VDIPLSGKDRVAFELETMPEILPPVREAAVGDYDADLKVIRQELTGKTLKVVVEGLAGGEYAVGLLRSDRIQAVLGADLQGEALVIRMPEGGEGGYSRQEVVITTK